MENKVDIKQAVAFPN